MFESYVVGVKLSLIDGMTKNLLGISLLFDKLGGKSRILQSELNKIKLLTIGGLVVGGTGLFGLGLIEKTLPYAKEYAHQLQQMKIAGMSNLEIAKATNAAWAVNKTVPTSTAAENLAAIRELRMVFGSTPAAISNLATVQKIQGVLANTMGTGARDEAYTIAKALELKGAVRNPGEFNTQADMMTKAIIASGGKIGAVDYIRAFTFGRSATLGWSDAFAYTILPTLIQEMRGGSHGGITGPGNALMSAYAAVVGGVITQRSLGEWQRLGLIDPKMLLRNKMGEIKGVQPGGIAGSTLFQSNPFLWAQQVLAPALQKAGIIKPEEQRQALQYLFPNRTAGFVMQQMVMQAWKFQRDVPLIQGAQGIKAYEQLLKNDPMMAQMALQKQWQNLLAIIGYQIMPVVISATLKLIDVLRGMAEWVKAHPTLTKWFVGLFAAFSALLVVGGSAMLITAAFKAFALLFPVIGAAAGPVGAGLAGAASGLGALGASVASIGAIPLLTIAAGLAAIGVAILAFKNSAPVVNLPPAAPGKKPQTWMFSPEGAVELPGDNGWAPAPKATKKGAAYTPYVPTGKPQAVQVNHVTNLDGRAIYQQVSRHAARDLEGPQMGPGSFDGSMHLAPVGGGHSNI